MYCSASTCTWYTCTDMWTLPFAIGCHVRKYRTAQYILSNRPIVFIVTPLWHAMSMLCLQGSCQNLSMPNLVIFPHVILATFSCYTKWYSNIKTKVHWYDLWVFCSFWWCTNTSCTCTLSSFLKFNLCNIKARDQQWQLIWCFLLTLVWAVYEAREAVSL